MVLGNLVTELDNGFEVGSVSKCYGIYGKEGY